MQTWAKRGLQTALVTGGLLMLGTGIASADEDVNPDKPASPLDVSLAAPVHFDNNALGTPLGQKNLPRVDKEIRVSGSDVVDSVPLAGRAGTTAAPAVANARDTAAPVAARVTDQAQPVVDKVTAQATPVVDKVTGTATPLVDKAAAASGKSGLAMPTLPAVPKPGVPDLHGAFAGNHVDGDLVVPFDVSGNAIALLGKAEVENESHQQYDGGHESVETNGSGGFVSGNVADLDWTLPVQITGNAVAGLGRASSTSSSSQEASTTSDVTSDGSKGVLSGNVLAGHGATPVQVTGNAIAGAGKSQSDSTAETSATSGGYVLTSGADSAGGGNIGGAPVATPVEVNGNGIAGLGKANAESESTADAKAGKERRGKYGVPTYLETNGDPALAAGNVVQPAASGPALLCGNAGAAAGGATADCASGSQTDAGGTNRSTGEGSIASGAIAHAPVALPVEGFGNAAAGIGKAKAQADNQVDSTAGGDSYTRGHDSVLSGTAVAPSASGPVDVFSNSAAGAGQASSTGNQDASASSGGNTGTTGDNSAGGGNMGTVPLALPSETFGNAAAAVGGADASATETKESDSGGGCNTDDDHGLLASNLVTTPVAGAAQAFGNGAGAVAFTDANAVTDNEVTAGGKNKATGKGGVGSGNIGQLPVSAPAQVFGTGASGLAAGEQTAVADTDTTAGGNATSDGSNGAGSGNVVTAPVGAAGQAFGESAAALGLNESAASSETDSTAGGDTETDGTHGLISGNVAAPQTMPVAQSFAAVASGVGGVNSSQADNDTEATSGGDIETAGDEGFLSGNLADVPAAAVAQPFGDAVAAVASHSAAEGTSETEGAVGGTSTTSGQFGSLSGIDGTVPVGANAPVYDVPAEVLAQAVTDSANSSDLSVGEGEPQLNMPVSGGLSPTELPSLLPMPGRAMPRDPFAGSFSGMLTGFGDGMTGLPGQDQVSEVAGTVSGAEEYQILPHPMPRSDRPVESVSGNLFESTTPVTGALAPRADVAKGFGAESARDLPVNQLPLGDLPVNELPLAELPIGDELSGTPAVPAVDDLGAVAPVDVTSVLPADLTDVTTVIPAGDLTDVTKVIPAVPAGDLTDVTTVIPAVPAGDLTDVTTVIPAVPAGDLTDVTTAIPAGDLTDVTTVIPAVPAGDLTDVTTVIPATPAGDLTDV
ncbi:MAG TPA: hypothetical protein VNP92_32700, partial [Actinophytocola sp.]|nr:hypothetical protein [Actinophytocola sp.]